MNSRHMGYPSPRGVHVPETFYSDDNDPDDDPYRRPRRNRYSRSVQQTPRRRDVTWISSPDPTTQTLQAPPSPWQPPPQMPSSPGPRPTSAIPPSPVPTVGERMTVDEIVDTVEPYPRPQRSGLFKSFWQGLKKKLYGSEPGPSFPLPWRSSYESQAADVPAPGMPVSIPSEETQYVNPASSGTETEQRSTTPYTSPYVQPAVIGGTPAVIPGSLRASPIPVPSVDVPPPITVISPSVSVPSSQGAPSIRSARMATPGPVRRRLSVGAQDPAVTTEESSQTLHEPVYAAPASRPIIAAPIPVGPAQNPNFPLNVASGVQSSPVEYTSYDGSLASTMARIRRFVTNIDGLPWVSDMQIADEYVPEMTPRSRLRTRVRQGADPSWYNARPDVVDKRDYWSQWDMWAKQSTTAMRDAGGAGRVGLAGAGAGAGVGLVHGQGQWGVYPHGYVPMQQHLFPSGYPPPGMEDDGDGPVIPRFI